MKNNLNNTKGKNKELDTTEFAKSNNLGRVLIGIGILLFLIYLFIFK